MGSPVEYARAARARGLDEIGFSDHAPSPNLQDRIRMSVPELEDYLGLVEEARVVAAREGGPIVRLGLECDWLPSEQDWLKQLSGLAKWDYLIGSIHYLAPGISVADLEMFGLEQGWTRYWDAFVEAAQSRLFDFLAHPDLPKNFVLPPPGGLAHHFDRAIAALKESGTALELNAGGWRKLCGKPYPEAPMLERAAKAGVGLVINSDAHDPVEVADALPAAIALAKACGFTHTVRFQRRQRTRVPLD